MASVVVNVNDSVNVGLNKLVQEVSRQTIAACAEKYGFDVNEACEAMGVLLKATEKKPRAKKAASDSGSDSGSDAGDALKKKGGRAKMTEEEKAAAAEARKEKKAAERKEAAEAKKAEKEQAKLDAVAAKAVE